MKWAMTWCKAATPREGRPLCLNLYQPVRGLGEDRECRQLTSHHGNVVAVVKPRANVAILVNLVGKVLPLRHHESLPRKKFGSQREQADAIDTMPLRLG